MSVRAYVETKAREAKAGARSIGVADTEVKNRILLKMADLIMSQSNKLITENAKDVAIAKAAGLSDAMIDRLTLNPKRIEEMAIGLREVAAMTDPVGEIIKMWKRPNKMMVGKMRGPIGSICIIYESRPNVTADAAGLCIKAGNSVILRGGSEAVNSNAAIVTILKEAVRSEGLHDGVITFIENTDRAAIMELLKLDTLVDLVIPRGGESLIRAVVENSSIPVLKHYKGVCHVFVDRDCDLEMASDICFNAKVQRPGTCNAMETMLVDAPVAERFLPKMTERLMAAGVEILGCAKTLKLCPELKPVKDTDYHNEYLALKMNVRIVDGFDEAIEHINTYSSSHTEAIVTKDHSRAMRFLKEVDSAAVMVNASTRLNDGGQFGLGAEIGISTDKLHARGPMGLEDLTCCKFIVLGDGQLRQ
ncbi:MAG: glutamate-5-semialdehyde dehydrogenase [Nitrospirae bacterium]|nr:glutamate-5-semialdehyde dehydrogenase [Nitrospirota bacterium]